MPRSFDEVYAEFGTGVHAYLTRLTGNTASAEELCQETFVRYLRHERALANSNGSLGGWLYRVATNLGIDRLRRRRSRTLDHEVQARADAVNGSVDGRDVEARIRAEVLGLPADLRATFLLRAHHGLPYRQIGEALGVTERAAKDRFKRTRELLMKRLAHLLEEKDT